MKTLIIFLTIIFIVAGCANPNNISYSYTIKNNSNVSTNNYIDNSTTDTGLSIEKYQEVEKEKIAILFSSSKIGQYASDVILSINTYMLSNNIDFIVESYDIDNYVDIKLHNIVEKIKANNIQNIMLLITKDSLNSLILGPEIDNINIYLPLINKYDLDITIDTPKNILFGAISYKKQFEKLIDNKDINNVVDLYDNSKIGDTLHSYMSNIPTRYSQQVNDKNGKYRKFLTSRYIKNSLIVLNTPIVKSSILLSQINAHSVRVEKIVSSQLNYSPFIFSLTQKADIRKLVIANSINNLNKNLVEYNNIMNNNIQYNWVNYSSILGIEYLVSGNLDKFKDITIFNNQIEYNVELYRIEHNSFKIVE